jgi:capsular polysaccharide biosynthesis protein
MHWLFSPPSIDDLIRLLKAWRFWSIGALTGALIGAAVFYLAPPPYQARATVLVDFNLEQAWPEETDRQQFYYLERETRKLEEIALSDSVMDAIVETNGNITARELRGGRLSLGQPAEGGWHFYVEDENPQRAEAIASTWTRVFAEQVRSRAAAAEGLNSFIEATVTQAAQLPVERSVPLSAYLFVGAITFLAVASFVVLFFHSPQTSPAWRGSEK